MPQFWRICNANRQNMRKTKQCRHTVCEFRRRHMPKISRKICPKNVGESLSRNPREALKASPGGRDRVKRGHTHVKKVPGLFYQFGCVVAFSLSLAIPLCRFSVLIVELFYLPHVFIDLSQLRAIHLRSPRESAQASVRAFNSVMLCNR